jgi:hypothetical protein
MQTWINIGRIGLLVFAWLNCANLLSAQPVVQVPFEADWEKQYRCLEADLLNRGKLAAVAAEAVRPEALILPEDRDPLDVVLRRTAALLKELQRQNPGLTLARETATAAALQARATGLSPDDKAARRDLYRQVCAVRRQIAFANPLLDFDQLLFTKHHRALYDHMCDQYYGMAARPGGGLYVLHQPFGNSPKLRDLLADARVGKGRLANTKLWGGTNGNPKIRFDGEGNLQGEPTVGGSFLAADVSFDGRQVAFAYVEATGDTRHRHHTDPTQGHWAEGRCYHLFRVNADGTDLRQLTDGTWNEFAPCWLPNGRIAFISERRGGYLRCGRTCPNYTLHDISAEGDDLRCLSFHETNEWHPSVTHDGRIIYTRWDYVDRHGCTAHQPWITTLDGRDSRAVHGNFSPRSTRPDMELDCRAIPGSHKFVATAAPHHGQAYGSLIIIDPRVADDDRMAPVQRLTPEVAFPETQGGREVYGTPWPLSEDFHLCVYDADRHLADGKAAARGDFGIYLVDSFGNKELVYRDPEIACLAPRPLRARPMPSATQELRPEPNATNATVVVMDVYDSLKPWPANTRIKALRVLQTYPMSVPSGQPPHDTGLRITTAGDSVNLVRHVLGTVPVEEDGSAHFQVPPNVEVFFQALDAEGLAVQSMRSATYLRPGETLTCQGCHEPKQRTPLQPVRQTLALRRPASRLQPDVDGSNPFSYPRLVQPVLDRNCVKCHNEHPDKAPNLNREPVARHWYASYNSLVTKYGFYNYGNPVRTVPGEFGARASKLYPLLTAGHHDLRLPPEDLHRIALWLDCSSLFYGVY